MGSETSSFDKNTDTPQTQEQQKQAAIEKVLQDEKIQLKDLMSGIKIADSTIANMIKTWDQNVDYREQQFKKPGNDRNDKKNLDAWIKKMEEVVGDAKRIASAIKLVNNNPNDTNAKKINDFVDKYSLQIQDAKKLLNTVPRRQNSIDVNPKDPDTNNNTSDSAENNNYNEIPAHTIYDSGYDPTQRITYKQVLDIARNNNNAMIIYRTFLKEFSYLGFKKAQDIAIRATIISYFESSFNAYAGRPGSQYRGLMQVGVNTHADKISGPITNPSVNAQAAVQVYKESGSFYPWKGVNQKKLWNSWA